MKLSSGFDGHGQQPHDVKEFLTYANPIAAQATIPSQTATKEATVIFQDLDFSIQEIEDFCPR